MTGPARRFLGLTGHGDLVVEPGRPLLIGRGAAADLVIADSAVSRAHAEIQVVPDGVRARDLGSANGTFLNGAPITEAIVRPGDTLTIGRPAFRLDSTEPPPTEEPAWRPMPAGAATISDPVTLQRLLALARTLSGRIESDRLIADVADLAFEVVPADRVALLLVRGPDRALVPVQSRSRVGEASAVQVPRAIAGRAVVERRPLLVENALDEAAFHSGSVVAARVRSAVAAPLLSDEHTVIGVLYADRIVRPDSFTDVEAGTLQAFAGLAAVSLAKVELAEALQRQAATRRNLERFLAPDVAATIAAAGAPLMAGGERRTVTVLFNDIRGFTPLAEGLSPEAVADLLTEFFSTMGEIVFAHGGTLDKYLGDGLMAVWGAPLDVADDAGRALEAARAMQAGVEALNAVWRSRGQPTIGIGIGLARGAVFAGRVGNDRRLDYTVLGDAVNLAARLCEAAAAGEILLTSQVRDRLADTSALAPRPGLEFRGRSGAVEVWGQDPGSGER